MTLVLLTLAGAYIGALEHHWLATGTYRRDTDTPRATRTPPAWLLPLTLASIYALTAHTHGPVTGLPILLLAALAGPLAWIDHDVHRLPNNLLTTLLTTQTLTMIGLALATGEWSGLARAALGLPLGLAVGILLNALRAGFGAGDVKLFALLAMIGGWSSWSGSYRVLGGAIVVNGVALAGLLLTRRIRSGRAPMGPGLMLGALLALILM